jgi:isopentenyldiphosphate isomerase
MPMVNATIEDCHKFGLLHDAVAIVLFDREDRILLILRSHNKFGGGKWELPATHCTGFGYFPDGYRCLEGEVGIKDVSFDCLGDFHYSVDVGDVKENEIVHVLIAEFDGLIRPSPNHCIDFKWISLDDAFQNSCSEDYTYWLQEGIDAMYDKIRVYIDKKRGRIGFSEGFASAKSSGRTV